MYQEFFWDFDGTLYNTYPGMVEAFMDVFEQKGFKLDQDEVYRHMRQTSLGKTFSYYRTQNNLEEEPEALREEYNPIEAKLEDKMKPFDGVQEVLAKVVANGGHNYLMTHRNKSSLEMLAKFDLKKYFTDAVTAEKKFPRKPNPASLNSLVEKYDLDPQNCVMVGDRVLDIAAAHNAKMSGILFDPDDLIIEPASPEHRIQDMHDILNWIK